MGPDRLAHIGSYSLHFREHGIRTFCALQALAIGSIGSPQGLCFGYVSTVYQPEGNQSGGAPSSNLYVSIGVSARSKHSLVGNPA
jgi:hypothetical protein